MDQVDGYASNNTVTGKDTHEVLKEHSPYFRWTAGERVLDIGCGPGDVTANVVLPFLPKDCSMVGCDLSEPMLESCKKYEIDGRLKFGKLDIQEKRLKSGWENASFDKIFSFYCLHWVTDYRQTMRNIYSLLKPGGEILLMFLTPDNAVYIAFEILKQSPKWNSYIKDITWFYKANDSVEFFRNLLESVGFQEVESYLKTTEHRIASWPIYIVFTNVKHSYKIRPPLHLPRLLSLTALDVMNFKSESAR
ncbi:unnamed protein product [Nezara viridula]|uniref:Methyltransferase type 12 domain-containing protein n=1 Tax=Nezara viridula TaxID=85310 RepID=A0A9P0E8P2_NEZVI|nr:unnamed protein product [Nezara viridula]